MLCSARMGRPRGGSEMSDDNEQDFQDWWDEQAPEDNDMFQPGQGPFGFGLWFNSNEAYEEDVTEIGTLTITPFKHFNNWMLRERFAYVFGASEGAEQIAEIMGYATMLDEFLLNVLANSVLGSHFRNDSYRNYVLSMEIAMLEYHAHPNWPEIRDRMVNAINLLWAWDKGVFQPWGWEGMWPAPESAPFLGPSGEVV